MRSDPYVNCPRLVEALAELEQAPALRTKPQGFSVDNL